VLSFGWAETGEDSIYVLIEFTYIFCKVLEFYNNLWGLGTKYRNRVLVPARQSPYLWVF
jgi:hypothetical protein